MKNLLLLAALITFTLSSCSSSDDSDVDQIITDQIINDQIITECSSPTNLYVSITTPDSAILHWENLNDNLDVTIEYGFYGFTPGSGTILSASLNSISIDGLTPLNSISIDGLTPLSTYDFYVKAICSDDSTSNLSEVGTFSNGISPYAGTWSGTYTGDDSGTWSYIVNNAGIITLSTSYSNNLNASQSNDGGDIWIPHCGCWSSTNPNNGVQASSQITGDTINGTWTNPTVGPNFGGTITGSRE